jgi:hypothetical protein
VIWIFVNLNAKKSVILSPVVVVWRDLVGFHVIVVFVSEVYVEIVVELSTGSILDLADVIKDFVCVEFLFHSMIAILFSIKKIYVSFCSLALVFCIEIRFEIKLMF